MPAATRESLRRSGLTRASNSVNPAAPGDGFERREYRVGSSRAAHSRSSRHVKGRKAVDRHSDSSPDGSGADLQERSHPIELRLELDLERPLAGHARVDISEL